MRGGRQSGVGPMGARSIRALDVVDDHTEIHVASVHEYQAPKKSFFTIGGSGGVSDVRSDLEGHYAEGWAQNIWSDILG